MKFYCNYRYSPHAKLNFHLSLYIYIHKHIYEHYWNKWLFYFWTEKILYSLIFFAIFWHHSRIFLSNLNSLFVIGIIFLHFRLLYLFFYKLHNVWNMICLFWNTMQIVKANKMNLFVIFVMFGIMLTKLYITSGPVRGFINANFEIICWDVLRYTLSLTRPC